MIYVENTSLASLSLIVTIIIIINYCLDIVFYFPYLVISSCKNINPLLAERKLMMKEVVRNFQHYLQQDAVTELGLGNTNNQTVNKDISYQDRAF